MHFIDPGLWTQNSPDLIPVDYNVCGVIRDVPTAGRKTRRCWSQGAPNCCMAWVQQHVVGEAIDQRRGRLCNLWLMGDTLVPLGLLLTSLDSDLMRQLDFSIDDFIFDAVPTILYGIKIVASFTRYSTNIKLKCGGRCISVCFQFPGVGLCSAKNWQHWIKADLSYKKGGIFETQCRNSAGNDWLEIKIMSDAAEFTDIGIASKMWDDLEALIAARTREFCLSWRQGLLGWRELHYCLSNAMLNSIAQNIKITWRVWSPVYGIRCQVSGVRRLWTRCDVI